MYEPVPYTIIHSYICPTPPYPMIPDSWSNFFKSKPFMVRCRTNTKPLPTNAFKFELIGL